MSATDVAMLRACCLILCLVAGSRQSSITEFVVPNAVEAGETAELHCRYDDSKPGESVKFVKWWWTPIGKDKIQLYQRAAAHGGKSLQHKIKTIIKENDTIALMELQPFASGTYECEVSNGVEHKKHQELIVYTKGTGPQLNISAVADGPDDDDAEDVLVECQADGVAPLPDLAIAVNEDDVANITEIVTGPDAEGLYSVSANVTFSRAAVEGAVIRCELFYSTSNITHPEYIDTELFDPTGALTSTETPEDTTQLDVTPESLENSQDDSSQLHGSWALLVTVPVLTHLFALL